MRSILLTAGTELILVFLLLHPGEGLASARAGMTLWLNTLLPTLLPFMILTGVLIHTKGIEKILSPLKPVFRFFLGTDVYGGYVFILGMVCGYPMAARLASDLYETGRISKIEALYLTTFCSSASPVFIITYLGHLCLNNRIPVPVLFFILFSGNMAAMVIFRFAVFRNHKIFPSNVTKKAKPDTCYEKKETSEADSPGVILDVSIMNGFETITRLGGYILLFSIVISCLRHYWKPDSPAGYLMLGSVELTTGLCQIATSTLSSDQKSFCALTLTSFGGFCVMAQTRSLLHKEVPFRFYIEGKLINAFFTAGLSLVFSKII